MINYSEEENVTGIGYDQDFLSVVINLPDLSRTNKENAFSINGSEVIDYTHFSLALNKVRRFAFWVAWNIDGGSIRRLSRKSIPFIIDPRVPQEFQVGDELYAGNRLDRGHIARRADLLWGRLQKRRRLTRILFTLPTLLLKWMISTKDKEVACGGDWRTQFLRIRMWRT